VNPQTIIDGAALFESLVSRASATSVLIETDFALINDIS